MLPLLLSVALVGGCSTSPFLGASMLFVLVPLAVLGSSGDVFYVLSMESDLGFSLVVLSLWVGGLSMVVSPHGGFYPRQYQGSIIFLVFLLVVSFSVMNGVLYYVAFEACLIPIGFLVICWGHNAERMEAVMYLAVYTVLGGSAHMVGLVSLDVFFGSTSFLMSAHPCVAEGSGFLLGLWWYLLIVPFLMKAPCYGFHVWLPKAHVEAPASGSMLLAAVLLKLGIYGLYQYCGVFVPPLGWVLPLQALGVYGGVMAVFVAIRQPDIKSVIAYASVSHMSFSVASLLTMSESACQGVVFMMISHGLTSSGLFAWAGVVFSKVGTRNLLVMSGMREVSPTQAWVLMALLMANSGMPPFFSFMGEVFIFCSLFSLEPWLGGVLVFSMIMGLAGAVYLFTVVQHSEHVMPFMRWGVGVSDREWLVFVGHLIPLLLLFVLPGVFLA